MRIAVSYKDGEVFQHFGHSSEFKIYETDHNEIIKSEVITVEGHGHVSVSNALKRTKCKHCTLWWYWSRG